LNLISVIFLNTHELYFGSYVAIWLKINMINVNYNPNYSNYLKRELINIS